MPSNAHVEYWQGRDGRWHYHRVAGGNITDGHSYASRRSCRRAIRQRWPDEEPELVTAQSRSR